MVAPRQRVALTRVTCAYPPAVARCIAIGRLHPGCQPSAPPAPAERHVLASQHAKFPQLNSLKSVIQGTYRSTSRTTRLTTLTAAATLAAVAAGLSASPAAASTGGLPASSHAGTVLAVNGSTGSAALAGGQAGALSLDATAMNAPFGQLAAPAAPAVQAPQPVTAQSPLAAAAQAPTHAAVSVRPVAVPAGHATSPAPAASAAATPAAPGAPSASASPAGASPRGRQPARHVVKPARPFLIFDSVTPSAIPAHHMIATYATGGYAVPASQVAGREVLWIDTRGTDPAAAALDVEPGDATPSVAASWAWHKLRATPGTVARIYTMISEWPAVKAAIGGLPQRMRSHVRYWIADPTGVPHIVPGASATQWYWGKHYDISTASPGFR